MQENKYPKWNALKEKQAKQLEKLEKAKEYRKENPNWMKEHKNYRFTRYTSEKY